MLAGVIGTNQHFEKLCFYGYMKECNAFQKGYEYSRHQGWSKRQRPDADSKKQIFF